MEDGGVTERPRPFHTRTVRGEPYIVGERGFELFVPDQQGQIIPHNETKQMLSGGGSTINIYAPVTIQAAEGASLQPVTLR